MNDRPRLLIEEWLPIAALGEESVRERRSMTALPPTYYLHVWWARRPLVASRAAILSSLLPADSDHEAFLHALGIHGDPVASRRRIDEAKRTGERFEGDAYSYPRAFQYLPSPEDAKWIRDESERLGASSVLSCLDPTAGGGSIPFEASRLGLATIANDLNSVAWMILKATVEFPSLYGSKVEDRYRKLAKKFVSMRDERLQEFFPEEPLEHSIATNWIWARTVTCPYCGGIVPLSPNWRLDKKGTGARIVMHLEDENHRHCTFEVVHSAKEQSAGTVNHGKGQCPFPDCGRVIDSYEIKDQAQAGGMGEQLYAVVYKQKVQKGTYKSGKPKYKTVRGFRTPRPEDDVAELVETALADRMLTWEARGIVPTEEFPEGTNDDRPLYYGMPLWRDMFNSRQLLGHCTSVEVFHDLVDELREKNNGEVPELDKAALVYIAFAIDKVLNYNARLVRWHANRQVVAGVFDRHDFAFKWSYAEMAPTIKGVGYDWTIKQTGKSLRELVELSTGEKDVALFSEERPQGGITIIRGSADDLDLDDASVDCVVMDPPYYDNVMYAELADYFYVWLKRTAGLLYPEAFTDHLTDKDREAVANPAKFKGQKGGAKKLAGRKYQHRMADIFRECRRVLKPHGVMTVMFTHKASGAWDALAKGLVDAEFVITASWPVNTEAEDSLHIKEKSAAKSTIFLVCRPRGDQPPDEPVYWEDVEPQVAARVRERVAEFQEAGIGGVDLYLACFGPALQVFSENWPLRRGRPIQQPKRDTLFPDEEWDPYEVRPEDALDAARTEVKRWRMEQLATVKRKHHLDPLTEWYVLAWDAFKAPRFPSDEALKLARVVGLDFDEAVKNVVCEIKSSDVILWDSKQRSKKSKLGPIGDEVMLDTLHHAALLGREKNTGAAYAALQEAGLDDDNTLKTALEALLNVLPPPGAAASKKTAKVLGGVSGDWEALENLRKLAFADDVPEPKVQQILFPNDETDSEDDSEE